MYTLWKRVRNKRKKDPVEEQKTKTTNRIDKYIDRYNLTSFDISLVIIIILSIVIIACFGYAIYEGMDGAINGGGLVLGDGEEYSYGIHGFLLNFFMSLIVTLYAWTPSLAIVICLMNARRKKHDLQK